MMFFTVTGYPWADHSSDSGLGMANASHVSRTVSASAPYWGTRKSQT